MAEEPSVHLVARWRNGDQDAAFELFRRYADRLVALARSRLSSKFVARLDAEDLVQSVYRCFFAGARIDRYDLQRGGDLWRLLVAITLNKLHSQINWHTRDKRSIHVEIPDTGWEVLGRDPSPVEALAISEELEQVLGKLEPHERPILELRLQGRDYAEIATDVGCSERSVMRVLKRVKEQLERRWSS